MCLVSKGSSFILFSWQIIWGFEGRWPLGLPAQHRMTSRTTTTVSETPWYKVFLFLPPLPHIMLIQWGAFYFFFKITTTISASWKGINIFQMPGLCFLINSGNYLAKNVGSAVQTHSEIQWWYEEDRAQKHGPNKAAKMPTRKTWMALMAQSCWGRKDTT